MTRLSPLWKAKNDNTEDAEDAEGIAFKSRSLYVEVVKALASMRSEGFSILLLSLCVLRVLCVVFCFVI